MIRSLCFLAAILMTSAVLAAPAPRLFVSGWDRPVDPDRDCKIRRDRGVLTIEMPGTDHDYDPHRERLNAPRLLRDFEGDFDIQVRVRIDCRPSAESTVKNEVSYVSAAFLIIPPDIFPNNRVRLEYRVERQGWKTDGCVTGSVEAMRGHVVGYKPPEWPFKGKPDYVYLRLERWGEILSYKISPDGKSWVRACGVGQFPRLPSKLKVGLAACTTSTDPSKVHFDQFKIIPSKKRESWDFMSCWGDTVDPDKDCKIQRDKDNLTIEMPGTDHDYDPIRKRFNAPRLISDLEGVFDLQVRVRIDYRTNTQSTVKGKPSFVSAGFLLIYPDGSNSPFGFDICNRLDFGVSQQGTKPDAYAVAPPAAAPRLQKPRRQNPAPKGMEADRYAVMKNWNFARQRAGEGGKWVYENPKQYMNRMWERGWQNWPLADTAEYAYLRLDHREKWCCFYISPDGKKWTLLEYQQSLPAKGKLALAAYSTSTEPSKVRFDQLKLWRDKKKNK